MFQPMWTEMHQSESRTGLVVDAGRRRESVGRRRETAWLSFLRRSVLLGKSLTSVNLLLPRIRPLLCVRC